MRTILIVILPTLSCMLVNLSSCNIASGKIYDAEMNYFKDKPWIDEHRSENINEYPLCKLSASKKIAICAEIITNENNIFGPFPRDEVPLIKNVEPFCSIVDYEFQFVMEQNGSYTKISEPMLPCHTFLKVEPKKKYEETLTTATVGSTIWAMQTNTFKLLLLFDDYKSKSKSLYNEIMNYHLE